jgi:hypothetical protein
MSGQIRELMEAADPARGVQVGAGDVERLLRLAETDITGYDDVVPHRRASWPVVAGAALVVTVAVAVAVVVIRPTAQSPGSPLPSAAPGTSDVPAHCLTRIADGLRTTSYDGQTGRYEYLRTDGNSGAQTEVPGKPGFLATVTFTVDAEQWLATDGSGRVRTTRGAPSYPDAASRTFYSQHPDTLPPAGTQTSDLHPGDVAVTPLPAADPSAMEQALYQPRENGPSQALVGVGDLNRERVLDAAHRAAELRFLAGLDGVTCRGELTDPSGRTGILVSADRGRGPRPSPGDQGREYLLVDQRTGEILASGGGDTAGTVTWSTIYLQRGYSDTL